MQDFGGARLLITFNEMGMTSDGRQFWGQIAAERLALSAIGFVSRTPNWFPTSVMPGAICEIKRRLSNRFPERITYGHSQGAYAAIKFSRCLQASTVIASAPQYSLDPQDIIDNRFNEFFRPEHHSGMRIKSDDVSGTVFVLYDPYEPVDRSHVDCIRAVVSVIPVQVPFAGHSVVRLLAETKTMGEFLARCVSGDLKGIRHLVRSRLRGHSERPYCMALALATRHPSAATALIRKYRDQIDKRLWYHVAFRMATVGRADLALPLMDEAVSVVSNDPASLAVRGFVCAKLGLMDEADRDTKVAVEAAPDNPGIGHIRRQILALRAPPPSQAC
jgi:hypothetical protein